MPVLITSHIFVAVSEYSSSHTVSATYHGLNIPFSVCSSPIRSFLLPNSIVQISKPLPISTFAFLLSPSVRTFSMTFCFCALIDALHGPKGMFVEFVDAIKSLFPYLATLSITNASSMSSKQQQMISPGFIGSLASTSAGSCLVHLELCYLSSESVDALFLSSSSPGDGSFLPVLRHLRVSVNERANQHLFNKIFDSELVSRLISFSLNNTMATVGFAAPGLGGLGKIQVLERLLSNCKLTSSPDFSVFSRCSEISGLLFSTHFCCEEGPVIVDLSNVPLLRLGDGTLEKCSGAVASLLLPPTLEFIGKRFLIKSSVEEIDFSVCTERLRFVDTSHNFMSEMTGLKRLDTAPLLGKMGREIGEDFLSSARVLTSIDLSGLRGVRKLGKFFLFGCQALKEVGGTVEGLCSVVSIGSHFCASCESLEDFSFGSSFQSLEFFGPNPFQETPLETTALRAMFAVLRKNQKK